MATEKQKIAETQKQIRFQIKETDSQVKRNEWAKERASSETAQVLIENQVETMKALTLIMKSLSMLLGKK